MRINRLLISNFKGVEHLEIDELEDMVVIAGPNGCGKSSVLDAIRLLKSAYGGYQPNEFQQWLGEFQFNLNRNPGELTRLLRNKEVPLVVELELALSETERSHLAANPVQLLRPLVWRQLVPQGGALPPMGQALASEYRVHGAQLDEQTATRSSAMSDEMKQDSLLLRIEITSSGEIMFNQNVTAETIFQTYDPGKLGVIDFYSAQRQYAREQVGGINLNLEQSEENRSQHLLYNWQNKLQNIKTELAASYVADLIARDAGKELRESSIQSTLSELFELFFQGKSFAGVQPTESGRPAFPVTLADGSSHDIDDLSSGEKEILYGYLRLRNARSRDSVILLDEPELHLNPRLVRGLPVFYQRHIGREFNNQIWLITHSDALLRESVGNPGFSVFHMHSRVREAAGNQAQILDTSSEVDRAIVDIVGDLAAYRPGAPILILEGGGESSFDVQMVSRLFPKLAEQVNLVSGGRKGRVQELHGFFRTAADAGAVLGGSVHAIVDRDSDDLPQAEDGIGQWNVYHIENYLLDESAIEGALVALLGKSPFANPSGLSEALKEAASGTMAELLVHQLRLETNRELVGSIDLGFDPTADDVAANLAEAIARSRARFEARAESLSIAQLNPRVEDLRASLADALESGSWKSEFRGRSVLKKFADSLPTQVSYDVLKNVIIDQMVKSGSRPAGMEMVLEDVLPAEVFEVDRADSISDEVA